MGGKQPAPKPVEKPKTIQELTKEASRKIKRMQRNFAREKRKLETNNKRIQRDIQKMLKKGEPRVCSG